MSNKKPKIKKNKNLGKKFIMFVKPIDKNGNVIEYECGWLQTNPETKLVFSMKEASIFVEKEEGHGSFSDWKKFFEEEYPNWKINSTPKYLD